MSMRCKAEADFSLRPCTNGDGTTDVLVSTIVVVLVVKVVLLLLLLVEFSCSWIQESRALAV